MVFRCTEIFSTRSGALAWQTFSHIQYMHSWIFLYRVLLSLFTSVRGAMVRAVHTYLS